MKVKRPNELKCECGASARDTSKERGRFRRRHPAVLTEDHLERVKRRRATAVRRAANDEVGA